MAKRNYVRERSRSPPRRSGPPPQGKQAEHAKKGPNRPGQQQRRRRAWRDYNNERWWRDQDRDWQPEQAQVQQQAAEGLLRAQQAADVQAQAVQAIVQEVAEALKQLTRQQPAATVRAASPRFLTTSRCLSPPSMASLHWTPSPAGSAPSAMGLDGSDGPDGISWSGPTSSSKSPSTSGTSSLLSRRWPQSWVQS